MEKAKTNQFDGFLKDKKIAYLIIIKLFFSYKNSAPKKKKPALLKRLLTNQKV